MSKFDAWDYLDKKKEKEKEEEEKKKTSGDKKTFDAWGYLDQKKAISQIDFDTFSDDLNTMNTTLSGIYGGWQDADTMAKTRDSVSSFYDRLSAYEDYRKNYGTEEDELPDLSELMGFYKTSLDDWDNMTTTYGQYKSADEYNKAVEVLQKAEDNKTAAIASKKEADEKKTSYIASDYIPNSSYGMTKAEYNRRRQTNPDMPEFGSYDYFVEREKALKPMVDEIAKDADRNDPTFRALADNYAKDNTWGEGKPVHQQAKDLYEKFNRQDAILAEYNAIHEQLTKFESKGVHYTDSLEVDTESGAKEAQYAQDRLDTLLFATPLTNEEAVLGFYGELPEDKQANYDHIRDIAGQSAMEASKESAYKYYEKNKDKEYNDNFVGRIFGNAKIGRIGIKSNSAGFTSYSASSDDIEASEVYQILSERIQSKNAETFQNNNGFESTLATVSQYIPQGVDQFVYGTVGKLAGNAVGSATASSMYMFEQTAGASFVRLLQETDLSVEDAKALARSESLASSAVEFGLGLVTGGLWSGGVSLTKGATSEIGESLIKKMTSVGISERGARIILNTAKTAGKLAFEGASEGLEEGWQEGIAITTDKYAEKGQTASAPGLLFKALDYSQYSPEERAQIKEAFKGGATIGGFMGVGNAAVSSVQNRFSPDTRLGRAIRDNDNVGKVLDMAAIPFSPEEASAYEAYKEYAESGMTASNAYDREVGELASNLQRDLISIIKSNNTSADQKAQAMKKLQDLGVYAEKNTIATKGKKYIQAMHGDDRTVKAYIDEGLESAEGTELRKLAEKFKAKLDKGKKLTTSEITQLVDAISAKTENTIKTDAEAKLTELGEDNASQLSDIIAKKALGRKLSSVEEKMLKDSKLEHKAVAIADATAGMTQEFADLFVKNYDGKNTVDDYADSFNLVSSYAELGYDSELAIENKGVLTEAQALDIYRETIKIQRTEKQKAIDKLVTKHAGKLNYKAKIDDSVIDYDNKSTEGKVNWKDLNTRQRQAITFAKAFAQGLGINLTFTTEGMQEEFNGYYDPITNTITLDVHAGIGQLADDTWTKDSIINTLAHEVTHWAKQKSPELYAEISDKVFSVLEKHTGLSKADLIADEQAKDISLTESGAEDEIVARACEDILSMSEEGRKIFDSMSEAEQKSFVEKIKELITDIINWVDELLGQYKSTSEEATILREYKEELQDIAKTWDAMLVSAKEGNAAMEAEGLFDNLHNGISEDGTTIIGEGNIQMSERTYREGGRDYLAKWLKRQKGLTQEDKDDILRQTDKVAEIMRAVAEGNELPDYSRWANLEVVKDEKGEKALSVIVKNGDYTMNIDFSQVCKKRVALNAVLNAMVQAGDLNVHVLTETDVADLNAIIKKHEFEIACALCFVDSKRYRVGAWAESFCEGTDTDDGTHKYGFNEMVRSLVPKGSKLNIDEFNFTKREIEGQPTTNLLSEAKDSQLDFTLIDKIMAENDVRSAQHRYARAIKENPQIRKILNSAEIISSIGLDAIRLEAPALYGIINGHQGTAKPKFSHDAVAYGNDVLKARGFTAARARMVGGVRCQSFSDFQAGMVMDYAQFISELSAKKLTAHSYTKEPLFVKLFGMTGMKINMSLVPKAIDMTPEQQKQFAILKDKNADKNSAEYKAALEEYEKLAENAGLDENGNYIWEDETFPYDIAMEIVDNPRYSSDCGTIAVGISKPHILKLLADDKISMVIPYHKSGLNRDVAMMRDIALYHDYTSVQNTRYKNDVDMYGDKAGKKLDKDKDKDFDFYGDLYGKGKKEGTHDPKKTAQNYLDWCDKHNYTPRFDEFRDHPNYYKLLVDFRVYDTDGTYREQQAVRPIYPGDAEFEDLILNGVKDKDGKVYGGLLQQQQNSDRLKAETKQIVDEYRQALIEKYGVDVLTQREIRQYSRRNGLVAIHNMWDNQLEAALRRGTLLMPSTAITDQMFTPFGRISVILRKSAVDPAANRHNQLFNMDAWTPQEKYFKLNPKFTDGNVRKFIGLIKGKLNENARQLLQYDEDFFKTTLTALGGNIFDDLIQEDLSIQAAYALEEGIIKSIPLFKDGSINKEKLRYDIHQTLDKDQGWRDYRGWLRAWSDKMIPPGSYDKATSDQIMADMEKQKDTNKPFRLRENGDLIVSATRVKSIKELKAMQGRLTDFDTAEAAAKELGTVMAQWAKDFKDRRLMKDTKSGAKWDKGEHDANLRKVLKAINDSYELRNDAEAIRKDIFKDRGMDITDKEISELQEFFERATNLPTNYFESKPHQELSIKDYVGAVVIPKDSSETLVTLLRKYGIPYVEIWSSDQKKYEKLRFEAIRKISEENKLQFQRRNPGAAAAEGTRKITELTKEDDNKLIKHFGKTGNYEVAGYMLKNGAMLDFSGKHWNGGVPSKTRQVDHRDIWEVWSNPDRDGTDEMVNMIGNGNIRLMPEIGGINLAVAPSKNQRIVLRRYIEWMSRHEGVMVDIDAVGGDTIKSFEYDKGVSADRVMRDIDNYFKGRTTSDLMQFHTMGDDQFQRRNNAPTAHDLMGEGARLKEENAKKQADYDRLKEYLKIEKKVTGGTTYDPKRTGAVADYLIKEWGSKYPKKTMTSELNDIYSYIAQKGERLDSKTLDRMCYDLAEQIISKNDQGITKPDSYAALRNEISKARIAPSAEQRENAAGRFGSNIAESFKGRATIAEDGKPLEEQWQEWAKKYPDIFDKNVSPKNQLAELYDIYSDLSNAGEVVQEYDKTEAVTQLATQIYEKYWTISPFETLSEKLNNQKLVDEMYYGRKLAEQAKQLRADHRKAMSDLRNAYKERMEEQTKNAKLLEQMYYGQKLLEKDKAIEAQRLADDMHYGKIVNKLREKREIEVAQAKAHGREKLAQYKENAERRVKIQSITNNSLNLGKKLLKNSQEEHIHEALKAPVINLLNAIDFSSKRMVNEGIPTNKDISLAKSLGQIKDMMVKASNGHAEFVQLYGHGLDDKIEAMMMNIDAMDRAVADNEFILQKMSLEDLDTLDKMVKTIKTAVNKLNQFHVAQHKEGIASLSRVSVREMESLGKGKVYDGLKGRINKTLMWNNALPVYAFERFGEGGKIIFRAIQDGWDKFAFNVKKALDFAEGAYTSKEAQEWAKDVKTFNIRVPLSESEKADPDYQPEYQKVQMTVPQIMSLYCLTKRDQAKGHILGGGIRVADFTIENKRKKEVITQEKGAVLEAEDINKIIETLTDRQKAVADKLQEFMNTVCTEWGNEVSMARFGYKAFGEENYFPIKSDDNNLSNDPTDAETSLFRLLNMSFTKSLTKNANNRVIISDIFDVFAQHASDMAKYNSLALPVLDAFQWYNYTEKQDVGDNGAFKTQGVKQEMESAFGKAAQNYFTTFLKDINGQKEVSRDTLGGGFFTNAKIAAVGANLRVVALQPTSYLRASAVIDNKYLAKAFAHKPKIEKAEKYCGIALWKSMGYYDTNIQRGVTEQIKHSETWKDKATELSMKGAEVADKITWGYLWNACELEIRDKRKDLKVGSEEFYNAIAKRLREVIYKTQVVDSTLTRSQMMRSSDGRDKFLTAFASEPTLSYNMLVESLNQAKLDARRIGKDAALKKHGGTIARTIAAYTVTNAVAALVESAFDAFRDTDDDDENDLIYFMKLYLSNFAQDMSVVGKIPYIKEAVSLIKGFSSSRTDVQWMEAFTKAAKEWGKIATTDKGNPMKAIRESFKAFSYASGLPFYNGIRDIMAGLDTFNILEVEDLEEMLRDIFE